MASTGNALEEWHRYVVPALLERIQRRVKQHCDDHHQAWPARARFARHSAHTQMQARFDAFNSDLGSALTAGNGPKHPSLMLVDENGEALDAQTGQVPPSRIDD
jgi:hypothetical protein